MMIALSKFTSRFNNTKSNMKSSALLKEEAAAAGNTIAL
jgi:hypothetical protein